MPWLPTISKSTPSFSTASHIASLGFPNSITFFGVTCHTIKPDTLCDLLYKKRDISNTESGEHKPHSQRKSWSHPQSDSTLRFCSSVALSLSALSLQKTEENTQLVHGTCVCVSDTFINNKLNSRDRSPRKGNGNRRSPRILTSGAIRGSVYGAEIELRLSGEEDDLGIGEAVFEIGERPS